MSGLEQELALIPTLSLTELTDRWQAHGLGPVPRVPLRLLQCLYAQLLQEQALGDLPASVVRELGNVGAETGKCRTPTPPHHHARSCSRLERGWFVNGTAGRSA